MIQFLQKHMLNGVILILILLIFRSLMTLSLDVPLMVYIYLNLFALPEHLRKLLTSIIVIVNNRSKFLTAKLLKQGYRYNKLRKAFSKFYHIHFGLIEKYHVSLKNFMQQGICNPEFNGDLVYKFKKIIGNSNFSHLFQRIANRFRRVGYTLDIMQQTACLGFNPIMVEGYAALFSCTALV